MGEWSLVWFCRDGDFDDLVEMEDVEEKVGECCVECERGDC